MNTTDKIAFFALGISIFTAIFSWFAFSKTDELSRNAFNRNYRPYITASNFAYLNKDNLVIPVMNVIMIKLLNAPAFVTRKKLSFYTRENNIDTLLFEHPIYKDELLYPLDNTQNTITTSDSIVSDSIARNLLPKQLIRKIRIEYQWISDSTLRYYFESEWIYNSEKRDWDIIYQRAD
jgi:hypothetical protein